MATLRQSATDHMKALRAGSIALSALRQIQQMDDVYKRNTSVRKIANAIQEGNNKLLKKYGKAFHIAYNIEKIVATRAMNNLEYSYGTNLMIEPISYIMYILYDKEEDLAKFYKINYKHVEKIENLSLNNKSMEKKYKRNSDIFLNEFLEVLDKQIRDVNNNMSKELYKIEKQDAA